MITRRGFFRLSAGGAAGTALGGLTALGADLAPKIVLAQEARIAQAREYPSVCPYCAVGCAQNVFVRDGKVVQIEGDPDAPHSRGRLCPKGAATFQLVTGAHRVHSVLYRRPSGTEWEELDLETAMDMVAERVKRTRDEHWETENEEGKLAVALEQRTVGAAAHGVL